MLDIFQTKAFPDRRIETVPTLVGSQVQTMNVIEVNDLKRIVM